MYPRTPRSSLWSLHAHRVRQRVSCMLFQVDRGSVGTALLRQIAFKNSSGLAVAALTASFRHRLTRTEGQRFFSRPQHRNQASTLRYRATGVLINAVRFNTHPCGVAPEAYGAAEPARRMLLANAKQHTLYLYGPIDSCPENMRCRQK